MERHSMLKNNNLAKKKMKSFCENIVDSLQIGIAAIHNDGTFCCMNASYAKMFGINQEKAMGENICNFFPDSELLNVMRESTSQNRIPFTYKGVDALISRHSVFDGDSVIGGFIEVYFRDIKDLKTLLLRITVLEKRAKYYKRRNQGLPKAKYTFADFIGTSYPIQLLKQQGQRFANCNQSILIQGESGTGKEIVSNALHAASPRADEIIVTVNCAAIPPQLIEAELFGFEEGSFTGARKGGGIGKFELADRGTIYLDEIGELPLAMQAKLLRVLENHEIQKIGSIELICSDFRLIAATNRDLHGMVSEGRFREDLYHRLNILHLNIPPLREHTEDLPVLIPYLISQIQKEEGLHSSALDDSAMAIMKQYHWPGNVRELKNVLIYALLNIDDINNIITSNALPHHITKKTVSPDPSVACADVTGNLRQQQQQLLCKTITAALENCNGNKTQAARQLGISRNELYNKLKKFDITWPKKK